MVSYWICHLMMRLLSKLIKLKSATICFVYCSLTVWIRVIRFILFYFLVVLFRLCPIALVARLLWPTLKQIKIIRSTIWLSFSTFVVELPFGVGVYIYFEKIITTNCCKYIDSNCNLFIFYFK